MGKGVRKWESESERQGKKEWDQLAAWGVRPREQPARQPGMQAQVLQALAAVQLAACAAAPPPAPTHLHAADHGHPIPDFPPPHSGVSIPSFQRCRAGCAIAALLLLLLVQGGGCGGREGWPLRCFCFL